MLTSTRRGLSYPNTNRSDRPDIPAHIATLVAALELDVPSGQGTLAARPTPAYARWLYWATDTATLYWWDGSAWATVKLTTAGGDLSGSYPNPVVVKASAQFALTGWLSPAQITGNQNDYNPTGFAANVFVRLDLDAAHEITGLVATTQGDLKIFLNGSSFNATFKNENSGSSASNRLRGPNLSDVILRPGDFAVFVYDGSPNRWRCIVQTNVGAASQLDYAQITADSSGVTATSEGSSVAVITGNSVTYDGTRVKVEVAIPKATISGSNGTITGVLYRDSTVLGQFAITAQLVATNSGPGIVAAFFDTPAAGAHTYKLAVFVSGGTGTINAGAGGAGALVPAFLRTIKA